MIYYGIKQNQGFNQFNSKIKGLKIEKNKGEKENMEKTTYVVSVNGQTVKSGEIYGPNGDYTYLSDEYGEIMFNLFSKAEATYENEKEGDQFFGLFPGNPNYSYEYENVEVVSLKRLYFDENGEMEGSDIIASYMRFLDHQKTT